jgi:hypothetical protein
MGGDNNTQMENAKIRGNFRRPSFLVFCDVIVGEIGKIVRQIITARTKFCRTAQNQSLRKLNYTPSCPFLNKN